eukprot:4069181-Amphidinium_carterae.1
MYYELAGPNSKPLKKVDTPYIPEKELMEGYPDFADTKADRQVEDTATTPQRGGQPKLSTYVRIDKTAKAYRTTNKKGPPWAQGIRRVTVNMDTKQ